MPVKNGPDLTLGATRRALRNGGELAPHILREIDYRRSWAKRYRELVLQYADDLGGEQELSAGERSLIMRIAMLTVQIEHYEKRWADEHDGIAPDNQFRRWSGAITTLRRLLDTLYAGNLKRRQRDVTPPDPLHYRGRRANGHE